ncbi:MAG: hypothetical protein ACD_63C00227G0002 [uncultured bacterium]|nr:MAG: hypothetical protein ACD_63C00227G0002 [uncultured bacterium]
MTEHTPNKVIYKNWQEDLFKIKKTPLFAIKERLLKTIGYDENFGWIYFDCNLKFTDKNSTYKKCFLVLNYHPKSIFTSDGNPGVNLSIQINDETPRLFVHKFKPRDYNKHKNPLNINIQKHLTFWDEKRKAQIAIWNGKKVKLHLAYFPQMPGWKFAKNSDFSNFFGIGPEGNSHWRVLIPRAKVKGFVEIDGTKHMVEGEGYCDQNWGNMNFSKFASKWYWGRIFTDNVTAIFADIHPKDGKSKFTPLFLKNKNDLLITTSRAKISYDFPAKSKLLGKNFYKKILLNHKSLNASAEIILRTKEVVEERDLLKIFHSPVKFSMLKRFIRPAYLRLNDEFVMTLKTKYGTKKIEGETYHEIMLTT